MSSWTPYAPPVSLQEAPSQVSKFRVIAFYLGFGTLPAVLCCLASPLAGGDAAVIVALPLLPLSIRLATWQSFRLRWRETPWFIGLFIAIPGSCLAAIPIILILAIVLGLEENPADTAIWWCRAFLGGCVAVAVELAVSNQLLQRSSMRDVRIAGIVGTISIAAIGIISPVLKPFVTFLAPSGGFRGSQFKGTGPIAIAYMIWILSIMLSTGLAIHRRARRTSVGAANPHGLESCSDV